MDAGDLPQGLFRTRRHRAAAAPQLFPLHRAVGGGRCRLCPGKGAAHRRRPWRRRGPRSEEHTSELQSLMRISYAVFCLKKKNIKKINKTTNSTYVQHTSTIHITCIRKHKTHKQ